MPKNTKISFRKFANVLRRNFPCSMPVKVRRCKMPLIGDGSDAREFGDAQVKDNYYQIRINQDHDIYVQLDTLMHEWAHCLVNWTDDEDKSDHTDEWGETYATIYRTMVE